MFQHKHQREEKAQYQFYCVLFVTFIKKFIPQVHASRILDWFWSLHLSVFLETQQSEKP